MSRRAVVILGLAALVLALSAASLIVGRTLLPLGDMLARPDDLLRRLGIANAATRLGLTGWTPAPVEALLASPPEVLVRAGGAREAGRPDRITRHPALDRLGDRILAAEIPERLLFCGGPSLVEAAARLAAIRDQALERRA